MLCFHGKLNVIPDFLPVPGSLLAMTSPFAAAISRFTSLRGAKLIFIVWLLFMATKQSVPYVHGYD
jgi:hypothetical protein